MIRQSRSYAVSGSDPLLEVTCDEVLALPTPTLVYVQQYAPSIGDWDLSEPWDMYDVLRRVNLERPYFYADYCLEDWILGWDRWVDSGLDHISPDGEYCRIHSISWPRVTMDFHETLRLKKIESESWAWEPDETKGDKIVLDK